MTTHDEAPAGRPIEQIAYDILAEAQPQSKRGSVTAMRQGRERAARHRRRQAVHRVRAYERWLKAGSRLADIPPIPSDADYRIARSQS